MSTCVQPTYGEVYTRLKKIVEEFAYKFNQGTDPNDFMSVTEMEALWTKLNLDSKEIYSDYVHQLVEAINEKELVRKKKLSSQNEGLSSKPTDAPKENS